MHLKLAKWYSTDVLASDVYVLKDSNLNFLWEIGLLICITKNSKMLGYGTTKMNLFRN